jgi:hypothetical protein
MDPVLIATFARPLDEFGSLSKSLCGRRETAPLERRSCRFPFNLSFLNFQLAKDTFNMSPNRSRLGSSGPALTVRLQSLDAQ